MSEKELVSKFEAEPAVDVSDQAQAIIDCQDLVKKDELSRNFRRKLNFDFKDASLVTINVVCKTADKCKWVKAWMEDTSRPDTQMRKAIIRCSRSVYKDAENIFASGVEWKEIE